MEAINRESAREKSIRHGHPSTLHLWWARRPLAAARAVLFAQLVDDPSSHPDRFPTEAEQVAERERLHDIIRRLVVWENVRDGRLLDEARKEILASTNGNPPAILDPFAGGGTIPLEAQRLGLEAHASDLNPVAVLINKALIEFPPKFRDRKPVFPGLAGSQVTPWTGASGLAADVRAYGQWMRDEAEKHIGHLYPKATLPDGSDATVIAWIWARTVTCPNPACGIEMPLVRSWWLGKKKNKEAYVVPTILADDSHPSGKRVDFTIGHGAESAPTAETDGTVGRTGATCISCSSGVDLKYVRAEAKADRMGATLMAVVAEGSRSRHYVAPTGEHVAAAQQALPHDAPDQSIPAQAPSFRVQAYGMTKWADLFTNRQLVALTTFSDLAAEARERVLADALAAGHPEGTRLDDGGSDAAAYADAVATYLAFGISKATDYHNALCGWRSDVKNEGIGHLFARQAIPMVWDYCEANPLSASSGNMLDQYTWIGKVLDLLPAATKAVSSQADASVRSFASAVVSTDPPYYDNIGYSDLSDFFYIWLRRSLRGILPSLFGTVLVPKAEELVANPYRHNGKNGAKEFFEDGFRDVFKRARESASEEYPITVYYAFKQSDTDDDGQASSGWETLLDGMVRNGWMITSTWPMRSELSNRMIASGTNALASSIVLSLRPRPEDAPITDRRGYIAALKRELGDALRDLQSGGIAPVDLRQATIGPGMTVFSRYTQVVEADGSPMTVRSALARINEILDEVLDEQEGDFDPTTRFAIAWYRLNSYRSGPFGDADDIARGRNTAVATMQRHGILSSRAGRVQLYKPANLDAKYDVLADESTSTWEALHHAVRLLESGGIISAGVFLRSASQRADGAVDLDLVKDLAYLLFEVAEKNGWTKDAISFNALATSWPELMGAARAATGEAFVTSTLDFGEDA
ncbi:DUF1156 domain-containing protein [Microbacterium pumilum]|uniref:DUF1156 domain-containing protein n=1 Tax=Microbacterium pumilum TaxID=344165 RepID=A0ABN2SYB8_9MICO